MFEWLPYLFEWCHIRFSGCHICLSEDYIFPGDSHICLNGGHICNMVAAKCSFQLKVEDSVKKLQQYNLYDSGALRKNSCYS